jgi:hypothetical protein
VASFELDDETTASLRFAARISGRTEPEIIAELVRIWSEGEDSSPRSLHSEIPVFSIYRGQRIEGTFDRATHGLTITSEPQAGHWFKSPSAAAQAVVTSIDPTVSSNRNGWTFWKVVATNAELKALK